MDAQDLLVHLMGRHLSSGDAKSWDGYLLLVTVGFVVTQEQAIQVSRVRSDTRRVRKLVVTGDDIGYVAGSQSEVERLRRCLGPLMSISTNTMGAATDPLASLPSRVFMDEQRQRNMSTIIDAHKGGKALVPALHGSLTRGARQIGKGEVK